MDRRAVLSTSVAGGLAALAGCAGGGPTRSDAS